MKKLVFATILFCCVCFIGFGCRNNSSDIEYSGAKFKNFMDGVFNDLQPGTAGSSLKAVNGLVKLLDYSYSNKISGSDINYWVTKADISDPMNSEKIDSLLSAMSSVSDNNFSDLMSEAGVRSSKYPWDKETIDNVNYVLNIIKENIK